MTSGKRSFAAGFLIIILVVVSGYNKAVTRDEAVAGQEEKIFLEVWPVSGCVGVGTSLPRHPKPRSHVMKTVLGAAQVPAVLFGALLPLSAVAEVLEQALGVRR